MPLQRTYTNFSGGQNNHQGDSASPVLLDNGGAEALAFAHESKNWEMAENGLIKYAGDDDIITSPASAVVTGEYDWNGIHILCKGTKVYTVAGAVETEIYPLAGTAQTAGKFYQFTEWDDGAGAEILLMFNGYDKPLQYNGSSCVRVTYIDDPSVIWNDARPAWGAPFRGSLIMGGDPTKPHRLYKPRPGTHNNFDDTESSVEAFDVDAGFGGVLTGFKPLTNDIAIIYKERATRRMSGINPFGSQIDPITLTPISDEVGCIAPRSIVQDGGFNQYYLSEGGLRRLRPTQSYGDVDAFEPTYPIQGLMDELNYAAAVIVNACAVFHKPTKQIWLSVPYGASTTNNLVIIYDTVTGGNDPRGVGDITASTLAIVSRKVYSGGYAGQIYKHGDDFSYHGTAIDARWESKWIAHNGIGRKKLYRELYVYAESDGAGELIVQALVLDGDEQRSDSTTQQLSSGSSAWDSAIWDVSVWGDGEERVVKIKLRCKGHAIKLRFINNANNQQVKIRQVDLFYDVING